MRIKSENFIKIVQTSDPRGTNLWPKFEILTVLGAVGRAHSPPTKVFRWLSELNHFKTTARSSGVPPIRICGIFPT